MSFGPISKHQRRPQTGDPPVAFQSRRPANREQARSVRAFDQKAQRIPILGELSADRKQSVAFPSEFFRFIAR
jgi:hypothetical protein